MDDLEDWGDDELFLAVAGSQVPKEFPFPFEPYEIQKQLMAKIYEVLDLKKIGIFESPTGTGKSMSMICGALKWLTDFEAQKETEFRKLLDDITNDAKTCTNSTSKTSAAAKSSEPDWITNYSSKKSEKEELAKIQRERDIIIKREQRLIELKKNIQAPTFYRKGTKRPHKETDNDAFTDFMQTADEQLKVEYEKEARQIDEDFLLNQMEADEAENSEGEEEDIYVTKIYFCSRTHSQLSQFVGEVLKSPYSHTVRSVSLGSRQNMCINGDVNRLKSLTLINDRCKELQKNSSKKSTSDTGKRRKQSGCCPYYNQSRIRHLTERALLEVKDIEDLVKTGKKVKACPYYAARRSVPAAQLVVLPYNTLLHNSTRKASGIQLKDNIVIIDEAHNLLETISNIHSVEVFESQLVQARSQLERYRDKYRSRLLPLNLLHVEQLINIMSEFIMYLNNAGDTKLLTVNDFLSACNLDNINFFALLRFCEKSQIARKLSGFVGHDKNKVKNNDEQCSSSAKAMETKQSGISSLLQKIKHSETSSAHEAEIDGEEKQVREEFNVPGMSSPLYLIENLLQTLTNSDEDGRVIVKQAKKHNAEEVTSSIRYLLLNPAIYFSKLVEECRSVIIAGGTMQPVSEFKEQLFQIGQITPERILEFSCGHVISAENILPIALSQASKGNTLDFTYQSRNNSTTLNSLSKILLDVSSCVPGGVVCFLPSYQYENVVINHLHKTGVYPKIAANKKIFREPKTAGMVDGVLETYSKAIKNTGGALLFSVVGGKMSEGINFCDDLGRCVVMVGLPYPNIHSAELKEKMNYLNRTMKVSADGMLPGQVHYENLCMKAVNQSIGRAIRHKNDYASILLVDHRYHKPSVIQKLPGWLRDHVRKLSSNQSAVTSMKEFFSRCSSNS